MNAFSSSRKRAILLFTILAVALAVSLFGHSVSSHLRAMSLLLRFSNPQATGLGVRFAQHPFREELGSAQTPLGPLKYRLYIPQEASAQNPNAQDPNVGGMVLVPGVHHLGIEDPRLVNFARAFAGAGVEVMTPEPHDLTEYRITPQSVELIGVSSVVLAAHMNRPKVGVMGLSFAGALALLAAGKPEYSDKMAFVVAIGAHDDLGRVSRFFATNIIEKPDGSTAPFQAHEYGALVLAYAHMEDFFAPADVSMARDALRQWISENPQASHTAKLMSPEGQAKFDELLHHRDQLRNRLLDEVRLHKDEMEAVSPHGRIQNLNMPVMLLHGAGDTVVPASETLWLARDVPAQQLKDVLISPALIHVNIGDSVAFSDKWALVDFVAHILEREDRLRP